MKNATAYGIVIFQAGARAPWQNGKTERHGAHFKELMEKARGETVIANEQELQLLMQEIEGAKNRFANRSGFSPIQRQIGQTPRTPAELLGDDVIDPALVSGAMVDDIERLHEMRRIAQKAFVEHNARKTIQTVERSRHKVLQEFEAGDYVYVFRVYRMRKIRGSRGQTEAGFARNKPTWVGPGTVVALDGPNLWVTVWGELWKVAREQCRKATSLEKQGIELVLTECKDVIEEYKRSSKKTGFKDLTEEQWPEKEDEEEIEEVSQRQRVRFEDEIEEIPHPEVEERSEERREEQRRASNATVEEPEVERIDEAENEEAEDDEDVIPGFQEDLEASRREEAERLQEMNRREEVRRLQEMTELSRLRSNRLDGHPASSESGGPIRTAWRLRELGGSEPYLWEMFLTTEEEVAEVERELRMQRMKDMLKKTEKKKSGDYWMIDHRAGTLTRKHRRKRRSLFYPKEEDDEIPIPVHQLKTLRRTSVKYMGNFPEEAEENDDWKKSKKSHKERWWKGSTTFFFDSEIPQEELEAIEVMLAEKRRTDDVDMRKESAKDLEEWKDFDLAEWEKVVQSGAVRVLSLEESRKISEDLKKQGKSNRILPTKIARRYKPSEQPGEPATKKSRLCLRGDLDPDIMTLEKFSPTVNTMNLAVMMQVAANQNMTSQIADFKNAFCQSEPLKRKEGELFFRQPPEGIKGVHPEQIVQIVNGCYGLVDAPLHWRRSLTEYLKKIGYIQSALDPCIYKFYVDGRINGMLAIEVDDLLMMGHGKHLERIQKLKEKFVFGKWVTLKELPEGAMFNGRRIKQKEDGEFQIDVEKFVLERMEEIKLEKGRAGQKKEEVTEEERGAARALCGSLNWLAKEGRPDLAGPASLMSSGLTRMKVEDIVALNEVVRAIKKEPGLAIRIQPLRKMRFGVVSDASFGNDEMHSQGGQMIICYEDGLQKNEKAKTNILCWRSGRLQRVCNSTLAAETQSLSRGMGDLLWIMVLFEELQEEEFSIREWPEKLCGSKVMALASNTTSEKLRGSLAVVDAKSLYDQLCKETIGGQDKRTAIEIQIIREDLESLQGQIRWVDHHAMIADGLTKVRGSNEALYRVLKTGTFQLTAENVQMQARSEARDNGQSTHEIRKFGINKNIGSCDFHDMFRATLIPNEE